MTNKILRLSTFTVWVLLLLRSIDFYGLGTRPKVAVPGSIQKRIKSDRTFETWQELIRAREPSPTTIVSGPLAAEGGSQRTEGPGSSGQARRRESGRGRPRAAIFWLQERTVVSNREHTLSTRTISPENDPTSASILIGTRVRIESD